MYMYSNKQQRLRRTLHIKRNEESVYELLRIGGKHREESLINYMYFKIDSIQNRFKKEIFYRKKETWRRQVNVVH